MATYHSYTFCFGNIIKVAVKDTAPRGRVKKGDVYSAVIAHTAKGVRHLDGAYKMCT